MTRKHRQKGRHLAGAPLEPTADYGPGFRRVNARQEPTAIAAADGLLLADIADVDKPTQRGAVVRVAQRDDPLWHILGASRLGDGRLGWPSPAQAAQHYAAELLRDDSALAEGICTEYRLLSVFHSTPGGPTQSMLDAQCRCRQAWAAIKGPENDTAVADATSLIVLGRASIRAVAPHQHCRPAKVRGRLITGLERLADYYGVE